MESAQLIKNKKREEIIFSFEKDILIIKENQRKIFIIILFLNISSFVLFINLVIEKIENNNNFINEIISDKLLNKSNSDLNNYLYKYAEFNRKILESYIEKQMDFCINPQKYYNEKIENEIKIHKIHINDIHYEMFIYTGVDIVSKSIVLFNKYEGEESDNILKALNYYAKKNKIKNNKDIIMLDIGGNICWYPTFLSRFGYTIITFEPLEKNYYLLRKNFCHFYKDSNVIIINKGVSDIEKNCSYYEEIDNIGNGMVMCDEIKNADIKET
jgi:hypothetical protein